MHSIARDFRASPQRVVAAVSYADGGARHGVTVRCVAGAPVQEGGATLRAYQLSATACNVALGGQCPNSSAAVGADYVERMVSTVVVRLLDSYGFAINRLLRVAAGSVRNANAYARALGPLAH